MQTAPKLVHHGFYLPTKFSYSCFYMSRDLKGGGANCLLWTDLSKKKTDGNRVRCAVRFCLATSFLQVVGGANLHVRTAFAVRDCLATSMYGAEILCVVRPNRYKLYTSRRFR